MDGLVVFLWYSSSSLLSPGRAGREWNSVSNDNEVLPLKYPCSTEPAKDTTSKPFAVSVKEGHRQPDITRTLGADAN